MIQSIRKNIMGTISFEAKFAGMRKSQEFIVYPIKLGEYCGKIRIQSETRIGDICMDSGDVIMSPSRSGGSYGIHMAIATKIDTLSKEDLAGIKFRIFQTAGNHAGSSVVHCDNSGADQLSIFQQA